MKNLLQILAVIMAFSVTAWAGVSVSPTVSVMVEGTYDAAGDILVGTGDNAAGRLAVGTVGKFLRSTGTTLGYSTATETSGALAGITTIVGSSTATMTGGFVVPNNFTVSAAGALDAASYGSFSYLKFGADPADAGAIRLSNATYLLSEADGAGVDVSVIGVDSSEIVQIGASGASGVTITPATTVSGALTLGGHVVSTGTVPVASAGTIDTKSTDHAGKIATVGATSVAVTFASAYTAAPVCVATAEEAVWISAVGTTSFTANAAGNIDALNYICLEIQ